MKRVLFLWMGCMLLVSTVASAEVKKGKDSFTNGINVGSYIQPENFFDTMFFIKTISDGTISYEFSISRIRGKNNILGDAPIQMKIDHYPVYELKHYRYKVTGPDSYGVEYNSDIKVKFPSELANQIKEAKRVAIQYEDVLGMEWPYVIPDDVLAEWKEVIATES